jgi:acylglycerol lipase
MEYSIRLQNGQGLRGFIASPGEKTRANIIFVHGIGEHIGRYTALAEMLSKEGIGFTGVDLPGHGNSDGPRGNIKNFAVTDEMIDILYSSSVNTFRGVPLFLYGHSLGGCIVLDYLLRRKPDLTGAIVTSPWLILSFEPAKYKLVLVSILTHILPGLVQPTGLVLKYISHDNEVVEKYKTDPLVHDRISVSLFHCAMTTAASSLKNSAELKTPLLLMHGSDDMICSPEGSRIFASGTPLAELKIWEGGYHELHNEIFKQDVFEYIVKWINSRLDS